MNYDTMKAAELKALCEERGVTPHRAKAVMIADLKARDAADELTRLGQELGLPDEPLTASEPEEVPEVQPVLEKRSERPVTVLERTVWIEDGVFLQPFTRDGNLEQGEHEYYLRLVEASAREAGLESFGPAFRCASRTTSDEWVYAINVRY